MSKRILVVEDQEDPPRSALFGADGKALMSGLWVRFRVEM
jgi:hypothetical protein